MDNLFKKAAQQKLRFRTSKGLITVEDLFDLPLATLDQMAVTLHTELEKQPTTSFIKETAEIDENEKLRFDILFHILDTKLIEQKEREKKAEIAVKRKNLRQLIAKKKDEALNNSSLDELQTMLDELEALQ